MKERHKRKERYSLILVSHTDNQSRQLVFSVVGIRVLICLLIIGGTGIGIAIYYLARGVGREIQLRQDIQQQITILTEENIRLKEESAQLKAGYQQLEELLEVRTEIAAEAEEQKNDEIRIPKLYPSDGIGELKTTFSAEKPYLTIGMRKGDHVVATADGRIRLIDYDQQYLHSIEVEHKDGYISRYLLNQEVEIQVQEGDEIKARDALCKITSAFTELDYQVLENNEALNPFQLMKAEE